MVTFAKNSPPTPQEIERTNLILRHRRDAHMGTLNERLQAFRSLAQVGVLPGDNAAGIVVCTYLYGIGQQVQKLIGSAPEGISVRIVDCAEEGA